MINSRACCSTAGLTSEDGDEPTVERVESRPARRRLGHGVPGDPLAAGELVEVLARVRRLVDRIEQCLPGLGKQNLLSRIRAQRTSNLLSSTETNLCGRALTFEHNVTQIKADNHSNSRTLFLFLGIASVVIGRQFTFRVNPSVCERLHFICRPSKSRAFNAQSACIRPTPVVPPTENVRSSLTR